MSFQWIVKEGSVSEDAAERIEDAVGLTVGEILLLKIPGNVENVIEFTKDSEGATVTFCQGRYKSRIKKLAADVRLWQMIRTAVCAPISR